MATNTAAIAKPESLREAANAFASRQCVVVSIKAMPRDSGRMRAAVIGLGQVGWRFDEEPNRGPVWTHVGAYKALDADFELVGACDPLSDARRAFADRHPEVPVFADIGTMVGESAPEVVSICTPNATHRNVLDKLLANTRPQAIWCEKPLATALSDGQAMVAACEERAVALTVSHVRRWSPLWQRFKSRVDSGEIGVLRSLRIAMPNRLWSVGSHGADLLSWLGGPISAVEGLPIPALEEEGEPAVGALATFDSGAAGVLQVTGSKAGLIVEAEAIGDAGRLTLRETQGTIALEVFAASSRYDGYMELGAGAVENMSPESGFSPFVAIAREIAGLARGEVATPTCGGRAALTTQKLLERLAAASQPGSRNEVVA